MTSKTETLPNPMGRAILALGLALAALPGCYASHDSEPEVVVCEPQACTVWRSDVPFPRGRMNACETCGATEGEIQARQAELGCRLTSAHNGCTLTGACDYAKAVDHWTRIREATTCGELAELAAEDPCTRPDPRLYWTPDGGCIERD